jgi:methyltransferase-like protein 6
VKDIPFIIPQVPKQSIDFATCIFVLSAISPCKLDVCVSKIAYAMKPGGVLFIRDYAQNDLAKNRFRKKDSYKKIGDQFYVRGDGTRAYYFSKQEILNLFTLNNLFEVIECDYCEKTVVNMKEKKEMKRIFLQARLKRS